jgi:hypothetical protein
MTTAAEVIAQAIRDFRFSDHGMPWMAPESARAEWVPALAAAIVAALDNQPYHVLDVTETGWTLKHPLDCRPELFACPTHRAADELDGPPAAPGRYRVDLVDGQLAIGEAVPDAG